MSPAARWLVLDGLVPLLGANLAYILMGIAMRNAFDKDAKEFTFPLEPAWDPMAWLYGTCVIAFQLGSTAVGSNGIAGTLFFGIAVLCSFQLMVCMHYRAREQTWKPPRSLKLTALVAIVAVLGGGYVFKNGASDDVRKGTAATASSAGGHEEGGTR